MEMVQNVGGIFSVLEDGHHDSDIHRAAGAGDVEALKNAIEADLDGIDKPNSSGLSPLFLAVLSEAIECVRILVQNNADVNLVFGRSSVRTTTTSTFYTRIETGLTPFMLACRDGNQEIVEFLFWNGANVRIRNDIDGFNCLSVAIKCKRRETARFLVTNTTRENMLYLMETSFLDRTWNSYGEKTTPLRLLIQYMPDIAEMVLDRCLTSDDDQRITCHVELLDDYFSLWAENNHDGSDAFNHDGSLKAEWRKPHPVQINNNHPLRLMIKHGHHQLLSHPVCVKLIEHKWNTFSRVMHILSSLFYVLFLSLITGYILVNPPAFYVKYANETQIIWYSGTEDSLYPDDQFSQSVERFFGIPAPFLIVMMVCFFAVTEAIHFYADGLMNYLKFDKVLEWSVYVLTTLMVLPVSDAKYRGDIVLREKWQWQCGAVAIFLAWINLTLYIRHLASLGIYVFMFEVVLKSTIRFMVVLTIYLVAFALAFRTLLLNQTDFHGVGDSLLKTFIMTTGELNFGTTFHSQDYLGTKNTVETDGEKAFILTAVFSDTVTYITYIVFVIMMPIIAMNLLIGVAVEDIQQIRRKAHFYYLRVKVDYFIHAENFLLDTFLRHVLRRLPVTVKYINFQLVEKPSLWANFFAITDILDYQESVKDICQRNQEREGAIKPLTEEGTYMTQESPREDESSQEVLAPSITQELANIMTALEGLMRRVESEVAT